MLSPEVVSLRSNENRTPLVGGSENAGCVPVCPEGRGLGRVWKWVQDHPSCTPGVSTFTGIGMIAFYGVTTLVAAVVVSGGLIISIGSAFIPGQVKSLQCREFSIAVAGAGTYAIGISIRKLLRGSISTVPVVGNAIIYFFDQHNGVNKERLFNINQLLPPESSPIKVD